MTFFVYKTCVIIRHPGRHGTYGGMSVREMEAMAVGLEETMDVDMVSQGPQFIQYMVNELDKRGIPVITPAGGLGCHINAMKFVDHGRPPGGSAGWNSWVLPAHCHSAQAHNTPCYVWGSVTFSSLSFWLPF